METPGPPIRNISDTARWVALYRAMETDRPDALFRDPLARRLAGEHGNRIHESIPQNARNVWAFVLLTEGLIIYLTPIRQGISPGSVQHHRASPDGLPISPHPVCWR